MVTLTDIKELYPDCKCKQVDSKQLFIVEGVIKGVQTKYLISYVTVVGKFEYDESTWYITNSRYSVSTIKQVNQFIRSTPYNVIRID